MSDAQAPTKRRLAVIGSGSAALRHAHTLRTLRPDSTVVGVRREGATFPDDPVDEIVTDVGALRSWPPDAAIVANAATGHAASAIALAKLGCHVLVEKPISHDIASARAIVDAFAGANLVLAVAYQLRHSTPLQALAELLRRDDTGSVVHVAAEVGQWLPDWRPDRDYRTTVTAQRSLGGGALLELSHELDYVRWLLGGGSVVAARLARSGVLDLDVEDIVDLVVDHDGVGATIHLDLLQRPARRRSRVLTTTGTADLDLVTGSVHWHHRDADEPSLVHAAATSWRIVASERVVADFLDCIDEGRAPLVDGDEATRTLELIEQARALGGPR